MSRVTKLIGINPLHLLQRTLPRGVRHEIIRRSITLPQELAPGLVFRVARTQNELEQAFSLLHNCYVKQNFIQPHPSGLYIKLQHALPSTSTLVAILNKKVIGTVSIIRDNPLHLPLEQAFSLEKLRAAGGRVAEVSALAIDPEFRRVSQGNLLFPFFIFLWRYALSYYGIDYIVIAIYPRHSDFYEAILKFEPLDRKIVTQYMGAPAAGFVLDIKAIPTKLAVAYNAAPPKRDLFHYATKKIFTEFHFPERSYSTVSDPVMTPELIRYFFYEKTDLFQKTDPKTLGKIMQFYNQDEFYPLFPESCKDYDLLKREPRFEVALRAQVTLGDGGIENVIKANALNVSQNGIKALLHQDIRFGRPVLLTLALGPFESTALSALPVWKDKNHLYGFKILENNPAWNRFITFLKSEQYQTQKAA